MTPRPEQEPDQVPESGPEQGSESVDPMGGRFSLDPPIEPMLAKPVAGLDALGPGWAFEPKWDGFRVLVYRRGHEVAIQGRMRDPAASADGRWDLTYAFPEMVQRVRSMRARDVVLDGELVVVRDGRLDFGALQGRLRPRKEAGGWKIDQLANDFPTSLVAFDLLAVDGEDVRSAPDEHRRQRLNAALADELAPVHQCPRTLDREVAARWFAQLPGAGLDGLIGRPLDAPYTPGRRSLAKIKPVNTADVVVAGWRAYKNPGPDGQPVVGSMLLGLHDQTGVLHFIGATSAFPMAVRAELALRLAPLVAGPEHPWLVRPAAGNVPGGPSRWSGRERGFQPLRPELVAEVSFTQAGEGQLRGLARFVRWRPDKAPAQCMLDQLVTAEPMDIDSVLRQAF